jgi:predicted amidohydrolase YtcJ
METGVTIANGTDAPVEDVSPLECYYASVTRRLPDGSRFYPGQCMTREEALRSYTLDAAYAAFEEETRGSITVGKLADMVVLSQDITIVPEEELRNTRVLTTFVGGDVAYRAE